jgi:hypothetical protein
MNADGIPAPSGWRTTKAGVVAGGGVATYFRRGDDLPRRPGPRKPKPAADAPQRNLQSLADHFAARLPDDRCATVAAQLGVTPGSIRELHAGWATREELQTLGAGFGDGAYPDGAFTFPEQDADGTIIGFSLRAEDGRKSSPQGMRRGATIPVGFADMPDPVLVVEGASDVAALLSVGLTAVGRPSNTGGADILVKLLAGREVIVLGERDLKGDGATPGVTGAKTIARKAADAWGNPVVWALPLDGLKDSRAWVRSLNLDLADGVARKAAGAKILEHVRANANIVEPASAIEPPAEPELLWRPFPTDLLPEPIREYVKSCAEALGCDESYIAVPLLVALAGAIGNSRTVELKQSWREPLIIWAAIVGYSGSMKTPAAELAFQFLRDIARRFRREHKARMTEYLELSNKFIEAEKAWKEAKKKSTVGMDPPDRPVKPVAPTMKRALVSDITVEAIAPILLDNPRGVPLYRDELTAWVGSFDRYARGAADAAAWNSMHTAGTIQIDRKTGDYRSIYVPRAAVSVFGTVQPGVLARVFGGEHTETGLLARILFANPPRRAKRWTDSGVPESVVEPVRDVFDVLCRLEMAEGADGELYPIPIPLAPDAKLAWEAFVNEWGDAQLEIDDEALCSARSKLEACAARFAGIVHLVRVAYGVPTLTGPGAIDARSVAAGVALARWFGHEARRLYADLGGSDADREQRKLLELVGRKGGSVSARELAQASRRYATVADAEAALDGLVKAGRGAWIQPPRGDTGRPPSRRFSPGKSVYVYETPESPEESAPFVDADTEGRRENGDDAGNGGAPAPAPAPELDDPGPDDDAPEPGSNDAPDDDAPGPDGDGPPVDQLPAQADAAPTGWLRGVGVEAIPADAAADRGDGRAAQLFDDGGDDGSRWATEA